MSSLKPSASLDQSQDILRVDHRQPLDAIFAPKNVAVIGATETVGAVGRTLLWNLVSNPFGGTVFPVNPKRPSVLGIKSYSSIAMVPEPVDLAVIATPAATVPGVMRECVDAGVKGAIVISAGFKEMGEPGVELERQLHIEARRGRVRLIGPNCLGVMNPLTGLNATFAGDIARPGRIAFLSQSGALCTAILDWSFREKVGFSSFVSTGSMLDIGWGDLIDYFGNDARTSAILIYMESIGDARRFLSAAREVALSKPIIVIKPGRTEAAAKAAASHTGSLTGSDDVLDAAFKRAGVLRVNTIAELFYMAEVLSKQPRPRGNRLTIITNAGGPGVLATDALIAGGGALAELSPETHAKLNQVLPPQWSRNNPIDVLGDAGAERYAKALEIAASDPNSDGLLVILTPQDMTQSTHTAELLKQYAKTDGKPVLASWMGGPEVAAGEDVLNRANIPTFPYPDTAARTFCSMHAFAQNLASLYETPRLDEEAEHPDVVAARMIIAKVMGEGRTLLSEFESKKLLEAYHISTVPTFSASTSDQAAAYAKSIGFPIVIKLDSRRITHKTDVGGVRLNVMSESEVRMVFDDMKQRVDSIDKDAFDGVTVQPMVRMKDAYELILGSSVDAQFGPVLLFGSGGVLVEVFKDKSLGLPPLNNTLARRMIESTKISQALAGTRGRKPVDMAKLEELVVRFSRLVVENRRIKEIDINPLLAGPDGIVALDARVVLHDASVPDDQLPVSAIRPYPSQYISTAVLKNGSSATLRPIRPEDEPLLVKFHSALSEESVRMRYFSAMKLGQRVAHERLVRVCFNDYDRECAIVAEVDSDGLPQIAAVGRLSKIPGLADAEFALLVSDAFHGQWLGTQILDKLLLIARDEGVKRVLADILVDNHAMQSVCKRLGFKLHHDAANGTVRAELEI